MRHLFLLLFVVASACDGKFSTPEIAPVECTTPAVYEALSSSCAGCHAANTNKPYFASQQAFEALLASKTKWVVPKKPDEGLLLPLLAGTAPGTLSQMPPGASTDTFSAMADRGETKISMQNLRCWIEGLDPATLATSAGGPLPIARRLSAEQLLTTLEAQLGISAASGAAGDFGLSLPDATPSTDVYGWRDDNYEALGGSHWLNNRRRNDAVNPVFTQTFVNTSQVYCRSAVNLPSATNKVLKHATVADTSAAAGAKIRENISYLGRHLLATRFTEADVTAYFELFQSYEPNRALGWTAVCAAMLQDPLWLTY